MGVAAPPPSAAFTPDRSQRRVASFIVPWLTPGERIDAIVPDVLAGISWLAYVAASVTGAVVGALLAFALLRPGGVLQSAFAGAAGGGVGAGLVVGVLLSTVASTYSLVLTDQRLVLIRRSSLTGRPRAIVGNHDRGVVRVTEYRPGTLFGSFTVVVQQGPAMKLSFRRPVRNSVARLATLLGPPPGA